jgi:hypothetical protein
MYYKSLSEFCKYVERQFPNIKEINVEGAPITTMFPDKIGKVCINFIPRNRLDATFANRKILHYISISPMQLKQSKFTVNVSLFQLASSSRSDNHVELILKGGIQSDFEFDCLNGVLRFQHSDGGFNWIE